MKRKFTKYPSKVYSAKRIEYDTTHMTYAGEIPSELVNTLKSVISDNRLTWFYNIKDVEVHWGSPYPTIVCILNGAGNYRLLSNFGGGSTINWNFIGERPFDAKTLREVADMLDVLNNSDELNNLIINFEELYGEEV